MVALNQKKLIFSLVFIALTALFLAVIYFLIFDKDKALKILQAQNISLQNTSPASVTQFGIQIKSASKLDENKNQLEDVLNKVQAKDNVWTTVTDTQYLKITFAKPLTNANDITLFARIGDQDQEANGYKVQVYIEDGTKIAEFSEIKHARSYKVLLTNLKTPQDTFYLKAVGNIDFDYVVDPAESGVAFTGGMQFSGGVETTKPWVCGDTLTDGRDSKTYTTVLIGTQCWMKQNLNYGTMTAGTNNQGADCPSVAATEKYCYSDTESNCTTYGALYQWDQMMCGASGCNGTGSGQPACSSPVQGICPTGWHVPSHYELNLLELSVCTSGSCATDFPYDATTTGFRGTNEGTSLRSGGSSGFDALFAGYRTSTDGSFANLTFYTYFWSSTQYSTGSNRWERLIYSPMTKVSRNPDNKAWGYSVRCVKN